MDGINIPHISLNPFQVRCMEEIWISDLKWNEMLCVISQAELFQTAY